MSTPKKPSTPEEEGLALVAELVALADRMEALAQKALKIIEKPFAFDFQKKNAANALEKYAKEFENFQQKIKSVEKTHKEAFDMMNDYIKDCIARMRQAKASGEPSSKFKSR